MIYIVISPCFILNNNFVIKTHKILINKLKALGLNQIAINWCVSNLRDREQIVDKLNHMFNIVHGSAPEYLKHNINLSRSNCYDTRAANLSCVMPRVKGFGLKRLFSTQLVNCGTLYLPTCNMLLTNICSRGMLKHIYGRNY